MDQFLSSGAIISTEKGKALLGWGKRKWSRQPEKTCTPSFYFPDFFMTYPNHWMTHEHWKEVLIEELLASFSQKSSLNSRTPEWQASDGKLFMDTFEELQKRFQSGGLRKAVPFIFEFSKESMNINLLEKSLQSALTYAQTNPVYLYGYWGGEEGMLGTTPELLFSMQHPFLQTMAVAGTATNDRLEHDFLNDPKERNEHQLVIEGITHSLSRFGQVRSGRTGVLKLPALSHLFTPLEIALGAETDFDEIVRVLHPTPALGAFPKDIGWNWLQDYQTKLDRRRFGAPAGYIYGKTARCYVAIRNIQWDRHRIAIGAGCGIIKESQKEKEWSEIQLKIKAIKRIFNL